MTRATPLAWLLIQPIRFYQRFISRYTPPTCRYYPCCSNYAITALRERGAIVGSALTVWRLLRCNPWSSGGVDHVPPRRERRGAGDSSTSDVSQRTAMRGPARFAEPGGTPSLDGRRAVTTAGGGPTTAMSPTTGRSAA